jgi:hypothetical protein
MHKAELLELLGIRLLDPDAKLSDPGFLINNDSSRF